MAQRLLFDNPEEFILRLRSLLESGTTLEKLRVRMPHDLPEVESLLGRRPSRLRFFALAGALGGFGGGLAFTIYTVLSWPIVTGGKPVVSLPPFLIIAYLLTILFGSLASFFGFLLLSGLPSLRNIRSEEEFENRFMIIVEEEP